MHSLTINILGNDGASTGEEVGGLDQVLLFSKRHINRIGFAFRDHQRNSLSSCFVLFT